MFTYVLRLETPDEPAIFCRVSIVDCAPCQSMLVVHDYSWPWTEVRPLIQNFADRLGLKPILEGELR
jgi:hypothetical protein